MTTPGVPAPDTASITRPVRERTSDRDAVPAPVAGIQVAGDDVDGTPVGAVGVPPHATMRVAAAMRRKPEKRTPSYRPDPTRAPEPPRPFLPCCCVARLKGAGTGPGFGCGPPFGTAEKPPLRRPVSDRRKSVTCAALTLRGGCIRGRVAVPQVRSSLESRASPSGVGGAAAVREARLSAS